MIGGQFPPQDLLGLLCVNEETVRGESHREIPTRRRSPLVVLVFACLQVGWTDRALLVSGPKQSDALYPYFIWKIIWKMLVNPDLWTAFNDAKEALLAAIKTSLLPQPHLLSLDCADRHSAQTSIHETLGELDVFTAWLDETVNDLDGACKDIRLHRSRVQMSLSPIAILPTELIRYIVQLAVGAPENRRMILNVSHVSTTWREAVTSTSELFTESDWNKWNVQLIKLWLSRAQKQPQKIFLDDVITEALFRHDTALVADVHGAIDYIGELWENLEHALLSCIHLHIVADLPPPPVGFDSWFQSWAMPQLHHLEIEAFEIGTINISENVPNLRALRIDWWLPVFSHSSLITEMTFTPGIEPSWSGWAEMLNSLPSLERLTLKITNCSFDGMPTLHLPLLHTLELESLVELDEACEIIKSFTAPNLKALILTDMGDEEGDMLLDSIVSFLFSFALRFSLELATSFRCQAWEA